MPSVSLAVGNIVTFRIWCTDAEQASVNTLRYQVISQTGSGGTLLQAATAFDAGISAIMTTLLNNNAEYKGVQAYVNQVPLPAPAVSTTGTGFGTGGANAMSRQTAGLIGWKTNFAGPAFRGRMYIPFPSTSEDAVGGVPSTVYTTDLDNFATALISFGTVGSGGNTSTLQFVIAHTVGKSGIRPAPSVIASGAGTGKWATQKRRGSYGRANSSPI